MSRRMRLAFSTAAVGFALSDAALIAARAQTLPDTLTTPPRSGLPFGTEPDRLPGPPRAMGELPEGQRQPPSTLPGRVFGQPPRAMGESPNIPGSTRPAPPLGTFGNAPGLPSPSFRPSDATPGPLDAAPGLEGERDPSLGIGGGRRGGRDQERPSRPTDLPSALPDADADAEGDLDARPRPSQDQDAPPSPPLTLQDVLASAERSYPPFLAILQDRDIAAGDWLSASGAFDLRFNADTRNYPLGYYQRSVHDVFLEQPLLWGGAKVFGGYRIAHGRFPNYYNYLNTRGGGAFVAGLDLPLLQDHAIDAYRAKLAQAEIERLKVEPTILKERVSLFKNAAKTYWNWVAAGRTAAIYRDLVRIAEARNQGIEQQVREGVGRAIDLQDFRRIMLSREQQSVVADRRFEQAAIELSLYLRDVRGFPLIPHPKQLPAELPKAPELNPNRLPEDLETALRLRPEILSLRLQAQKIEVERQFARNQLLPSLDLYLYGEQNVGVRDKDLGKDFRPFVMESSLLLNVPIQRRQARGRVQASDAALRQMLMQVQFAADRVRADVQDAASALRAARDQLTRYQESEQVAQRLERAEEIAIREGAGTILFLNLREQATSDAQVARIEAEAKVQSAIADYRAALGLDAAGAVAIGGSIPPPSTSPSPSSAASSSPDMTVRQKP